MLRVDILELRNSVNAALSFMRNVQLVIGCLICLVLRVGAMNSFIMESNFQADGN